MHEPLDLWPHSLQPAADEAEDVFENSFVQRLVATNLLHEAIGQLVFGCCRIACL